MPKCDRRSASARSLPRSPFRRFVLAAWVGVSILTLPSVAPLAKPRVSMVITVKDWERKDHPFVVGPRNPRWTPYGAIPAALKKAVVASEDANFYSHEGVDYEAIRRGDQDRLAEGEVRPRREHDHAAAGEEPLPDPREDVDPEGEGDRPREAHGRRLVEIADPRTVPQRGRTRADGVRGRARRALLLRKAPFRVDRAGVRVPRLNAPRPESLQPVPEDGPGDAAVRPDPAEDGRGADDLAGGVRRGDGRGPEPRGARAEGGEDAGDPAARGEAARGGSRRRPGDDRVLPPLESPPPGSEEDSAPERPDAD